MGGIFPNVSNAKDGLTVKGFPSLNVGVFVCIIWCCGTSVKERQHRTPGMYAFVEGKYRKEIGVFDCWYQLMEVLDLPLYQNY